MNNQPTSETSHPKFWKSQKFDLKKRMEKNTSGESNTALSNASGSTAIQKTTGSVLVPHQMEEVALNHQVRETETII